MSEPIKSINGDFLDKLERAAFDFFINSVNPQNGLVPDTTRPGSPCSIAVTGFALTAYTVGVEREWVSRKEAASLTLVTMRFFWNSASSEHDGVTGYQGFFYHFLDMHTGLRMWDCELSMIDTAFLIAGVLAAGAYFTESTPDEQEIRQLSEKLYLRVNWEWARNGGATLSQGWKPACGFLHYGWDGYNEGTLLYVLALASPSFPLDAGCYKNWAVTYQWENIYGYDLLYAGPLFIHQFSHAWIDFRGIRDEFMEEKGSDYFENSKAAVLVQRDYCRRNPLRFAGYGENFWGLSAGEGPADRAVRVRERERWCFGYSARGAPHGPDDGTISPSAVVASIPFVPDLAVAALETILSAHPYLLKDYLLPTGFNATAVEPDGRAWVSEGFFGLDQGIVALMLENFRSGFVWALMKKSPYVVSGLKRAGFKHGWLT